MYQRGKSSAHLTAATHSVGSKVDSQGGIIVRYSMQVREGPCRPEIRASRTSLTISCIGHSQALCRKLDLIAYLHNHVIFHFNYYKTCRKLNLSGKEVSRSVFLRGDGRIHLVWCPTAHTLALLLPWHCHKTKKMYPPTGGFDLDIGAISGICGSISIACWVVVFSPQIIENFRRSSAEGLSIEFVIIWLLGDIFNILGAVLQGVLSTMIILAIYYTFADVVLLAQCFYYRGFVFRDPKPSPPGVAEPSEQSPLLQNGHASTNSRPANAADVEAFSRNRSPSSFRERFASLDGTHLSPVTPMHPRPKTPNEAVIVEDHKPRSWAQAILFNSTAIILVVLAGVAGYYLSPSSPEQDDSTAAEDQAKSLQFSLWGQIFGYICAVLYLGSRIPQLLLNYRRKSTEGLNALFFLFACIGNLTYVLSIFAFDPVCSRYKHGHWKEITCKHGEASAIYGRYILVNLSWLLGSLGTLFLDFGVFVQFFMYRSNAAKANGVLSEDVDSMPRTEDGLGRGREPNER